MDPEQPTEKTGLLDPQQHLVNSQDAKHEDQTRDEKTTDSKCDRFCAFLKSTNFLLYCSHALSAWGDRMWQFATGMFLVALNPDSLRLTAIYGFSSGGCILLFGALVGNLVDKHSRLNVARGSLVIQNVSVGISASIVCVTIYFAEEIRSQWAGLEQICHMFIIIFAVVADVASIGRQISIERDWIVVICPDTSSLTSMSAFLRRIDLTTKLAAPIVTGQVITFGSMTIGAVFIAGWNIVSVFVEYCLLYAVYKSVPELAFKENVSPDTDSASETTEKTPLLQEEKVGTDYGFVKTSHSQSYDKDITGSIHGDAETKKGRRRSWAAQTCLMFFDSFLVLIRGWKTYMNQRIVFAGLGLACLYMTVMGFDNITTGYAKEQGLSESTVGILMGCGALVGILGTMAFPRVRHLVGLERTGLIALGIQITCLLACVTSIFVPGSPFDPGFLLREYDEPTSGPHCEPDMDNPQPKATTDFNVTNSTRLANCTLVDESQTVTTEPSSYVSIILLMAGIVFSRFGLWMADLTVTQLLLEAPADHERGIVNGVQNSLNSLMDLLKFALVIFLPWPQTFGILILLSFAFVCTGTVLYSIYSHKTRGHLFHFDKYGEDLLRYRFQNPETRLYAPLTT